MQMDLAEKKAVLSSTTELKRLLSSLQDLVARSGACCVIGTAEYHMLQNVAPAAPLLLHSVCRKHCNSCVMTSDSVGRA